MNKTFPLLAALLAAASMEACAAAPLRIDPARAAGITDGVYDRARVADLFGVPEDTEHFRVARGRCTDAWHWSNPTSTTFENLTVYFDANGVVCHHAYSGPDRPRAALGSAVPAQHLGRLARR